MNPDLCGVVYICWHLYLQDPGLAIVCLTSSEDTLDSQSDYQKEGVSHLPTRDTLVQYLEQSASPGGISIFEKKGVIVLVVRNNGKDMVLEVRKIHKLGGTGHCVLRHCML